MNESVQVPDDGSQVCSLHLSRPDTIPLAASMAAEAAGILGLAATPATQLRGLVLEVVTAIVADGFGDATDIDVDVAVQRRPGGLSVVVSDRGAPSDFTNGDYPAQIAELVRLGYADSLHTTGLGLEGNRTVIDKDLSFRTVAEDADFQEGADLEAEGSPVDVSSEDIAVRAMTPGDVLGVARLFYRCYGYSAYYLTTIFEPAKLAELVEAGHHFATVAVTPAGRIVAHIASEISSPDAVTGNAGEAAVDPDFRSMGLSLKVGALHLQRLVERGMVGQFTQAVTNHNRSQKAGLAIGAHEVGLLLAGQRPSLHMAGFDTNGDPEVRRAVMLMFLGMPQLKHRTVHVPPVHAEMVRRIYSNSSLDRTVVSDFDRDLDSLPERTRFSVALKPESALASITVQDYGRDFLTALQDQLERLRLSRYDIVLVYLPLAPQGAASLGSGLNHIGLTFCGVYPEYQDGDVMVLQLLNNQRIDPAAIVTASPFGEELRDYVVADYERAVSHRERRQRGRATMDRIYEAFP
jgi:hypothetical protein